GQTSELLRRTRRGDEPGRALLHQQLHDATAEVSARARDDQLRMQKVGHTPPPVSNEKVASIEPNARRPSRPLGQAVRRAGRIESTSRGTRLDVPRRFTNLAELLRMRKARPRPRQEEGGSRFTSSLTRRISTDAGEASLDQTSTAAESPVQTPLDSREAAHDHRRRSVRDALPRTAHAGCARPPREFPFGARGVRSTPSRDPDRPARSARAVPRDRQRGRLQAGRKVARNRVTEPFRPGPLKRLLGSWTVGRRRRDDRRRRTWTFPAGRSSAPPP